MVCPLFLLVHLPAKSIRSGGLPGSVPGRAAFTPRERALVARLRTPAAVQLWLKTLPYNWETAGETLRSFRNVARLRTAHCLEAALAAATILEPHGYPPLLLSFVEDSQQVEVRRFAPAGQIGDADEQ